jgi:hypothetical protein
MMTKKLILILTLVYCVFISSCGDDDYEECTSDDDCDSGAVCVKSDPDDEDEVGECKADCLAFDYTCQLVD